MPGLKRRRLLHYYQPREAAFSPDQIDGLARWYDANTIEGLADTDPVATWEDLSDSGEDAAQGTAGQRPTYRTGVKNGLPAVLFDGVDNELTFTGLTLNADFTLFVVYNVTAFGAGNCLLGNTANSLVWVGGTDAGFDGIGIYDGTRLQETGAETTGWAVGTWQKNAIWRNGVSQTITEVIVGDIASLVLNRIGSRDGSTGWHNDYIAEILIYDTILETADREAVEDYLMTKWGI